MAAGDFTTMGEPRGYAKQKIQIEDFPGLMDNIDPFDAPAGAGEIQVNCCSILLGELRVRSGYREVKFEAAF